MRLSIGVISLFLAGKALGFTDTASFFSSQDLDGDFDYITEASVLSQSVKELSDRVCRNKQKLTIYRMIGLKELPVQDLGVFVKHVHYASANELDFTLGESCEHDVQYLKYGEVESADKAITIVDVEQESVPVEDLLSGAGHIIIQGKPSFRANKIEGFKNYIEDQVYENLNIELEVDSSKRSTNEESDDEEEFEKLLEEVKNDMKDAESYITKEGNNGMVSALASPKASDGPSTDAPKVHVQSNLFTNYQFFTTGLWSCIIVSFVLFFILYTALGWMTSIEITYLSFEKQVDYEKKTE